MITQAKGKFIRLAPLKVQRVIDLIRGRDVLNAITILTHAPQRPTGAIKKILNSAISNAKQKGLREDQLFISKILADKGPMWKRFKASAFGRATPILKRTTHLTIELDVKVK